MFKCHIIFLVLFFASCKQDERPRIEKYRQEILNIQRKERQAHFNKDVGLFLSQFKDTAIFVNKGDVQLFLKKQNSQRFSEYFSSVDFVKWDDVAEPIIHFSNDGSLAYAIVQKQVIIKEKSTDKVDTVNYAWLSAYRRTGNHWMLECNVSTNE